jgi:hypothetical protein
VRGDELHRPRRLLAFEVAVEGDRLVVLPQVRLSVAPHVGVPIDVAGEVAPEVVEAMPVRVVFGTEAEMPLADEARGVSGLLQQLRERMACRAQPLSEAAAGPRVERPLEQHALLIPPRDERRPGRRADRRVGVEVGEAHALARQAVEVRRPDVRST